MRLAVVKEDFVTDILVAEWAEKPKLEHALDAELVDAAPFNLCVGDYRRPGVGWTRNEGGEQIVLTERPTYDELVEALMSLGVEFS